tara:strand:- start:565 stop:828 length:264 start_codon:yes stop_codon:yes gene_type:complete
MSFTHIATKSKPKFSSFFESTAIFNFVPTPSVLLKRMGSLYLSFFRSNNDANPPGFLIISFRKFFFEISSIFFTSFEVFSISTPDDL